MAHDRGGISVDEACLERLASAPASCPFSAVENQRAGGTERVASRSAHGDGHLDALQNHARLVLSHHGEHLNRRPIRVRVVAGNGFDVTLEQL